MSAEIARSTAVGIGAYKVVKTLGEGSFGKVKLAIHQGTGQQVALKIIASSVDFRTDFAAGIKFWTTAAHESTVSTPCTLIAV